MPPARSFVERLPCRAQMSRARARAARMGTPRTSMDARSLGYVIKHTKNTDTKNTNVTTDQTIEYSTEHTTVRSRGIVDTKRHQTIKRITSTGTRNADAGPGYLQSTPSVVVYICMHAGLGK